MYSSINGVLNGSDYGITQQTSTNKKKTCITAVKAGTVGPFRVIRLIRSTNVLKCRWSFSVLLVLNNFKAAGVLY